MYKLDKTRKAFVSRDLNLTSSQLDQHLNFDSSLAD